MIEIENALKNALLVFAVDEKTESDELRIQKEELSSLVDTMGLAINGDITFHVKTPNAATYIGKGQVEKIKAESEEKNAEIIVFDLSLPPRIQRNLEEALSLCVIDREEVILQIFSDNARTREARLQIDLARAVYSLPRLSRRWESLSQQRGGVRGSKGEGEKQIELDRRHLMTNLVSIKKELEDVQKSRIYQRKNREKNEVFSFALVGYTNAGKSSLMKALSGADVLIENKLFATLDTTTRRIELPGRHEALLTDTVGFVSRLPHSLVESFKSTLEEACRADALILVLDASHPDLVATYETTRSVLTELGALNKPTITVLNKSDAIHDEIAVEKIAVTAKPFIRTSVKESTGLEELKKEMEHLFEEAETEIELLIPNEEGKALSELYAHAIVQSVSYEEDGIHVKAICAKDEVQRFIRFTHLH